MHEAFLAFTIITVALIVMNFFILHLTNKEVKYLVRLDLKKAKMLEIDKCKWLLVFNERKKCVVSQFVFVCIILFYITNIVGIMLLGVHLITNRGDFFWYSYGIFFSSNMTIFICLLNKVSLNGEQQKIRAADIKKRKFEKKEQD